MTVGEGTQGGIRRNRLTETGGGESSRDYAYRGTARTWDDGYFWGPITAFLDQEAPPPRRLLEVGCGNGFAAKRLTELGYEVTGIEPSSTAILFACENCPTGRFIHASAYDPLPDDCGPFDIVLSIEVVEHVLFPREFAARLFAALRPGGIGILTTPFHGWFKNVAIAVSGRFDSHVNPLWEGGHVKFFSPRTIGTLLRDAGFTDIDVRRAGRVPALAKSMVVSFRKGLD